MMLCGYEGNWVVECVAVECQATHGTAYDSEAKAIAAWNRRPQPIAGEWEGAIEAAAKIIEGNTILYRGEGGWALKPRMHGQSDGLYYAEAIRALRRPAQPIPTIPVGPTEGSALDKALIASTTPVAQPQPGGAEVMRALKPFRDAWHYSCHPNAGEGLPWNTTPEHYEAAANAYDAASIDRPAGDK